VDKKAVVLGLNNYIGLGAARSLGKEGIEVIAVDEENLKSRYGLHTKYISHRMKVPNILEEAELVLEALLKYGKSLKKKPLLLPTIDKYVEFLDEYMDELREYYVVPPIAKGLYTKLMDKDTLSAVALENNLLTPKIIEPGSFSEKEALYEKIQSEIGFPCLIKPVTSHSFVAEFREKMFVAENRKDLEEGLERAKAAHQKVFIQQLIKGFDDHMYTFDCYIDKTGNLTHWATFQKKRQFPINYGASTYVKQRYVQELYDIGANFLLNIEYRGFAEMEFKLDAEDGKFYLIEINVRTTNFNRLLDKLGINVPSIMFKDLNNERIGGKEIKTDTELYFWSGYEDFAAIRGYLKEKQLTAGQIISSLFNKKVYAIWSIKDPLPGIVFVVEKLKNGLGRFFTKITEKQKRVIKD